MPLVRIDLASHHSREAVCAIGEEVHEALVAIAGVARDDRCQIVSRHSDYELIYPQSGFREVRYSHNIVFIQIILAKGRGKNVKRALYAAIVKRITSRLPLSGDDIWISLVESKREDWSYGSGRMLDPA